MIEQIELHESFALLGSSNLQKDTFVVWRHIPGRGSVPIAAKGERARLKKSGKKFETEANKAKKDDKKRGKPKAGSKGGATKPFNSANDEKEGFKNITEVRKWMKDSGMSEHGKNLSDEEAGGLGYYTQADYSFTVINDRLRTGKHTGETAEFVQDATKSEVTASINGMTSAIERSVFPEDITLFRGQTVDKDMLAKMKPGAVFSDNGFISTSVSKKGAFHSSADIIIKAPKGTKGMEVFSRGNKTKTANPGQMEVILQRGTRFRVESVGTVDKGEIHGIKPRIVVSVDSQPTPTSNFAESRLKKAIKSGKIVDPRIAKFLWSSADLSFG